MKPKATLAVLSLILVALSGCGGDDDQSATIASRVARAASQSIVTTMSETTNTTASGNEALESEPLRLASTRPNSIISDTEFSPLSDNSDVAFTTTVEAAEGARESMSLVGSFITAAVLAPSTSKPCAGKIRRLEIASVTGRVVKKPCPCAALDTASRT